MQDPDTLEDISFDKLERHFRINVFAQFILAKCCLPHMRPGSSIINTTSITAYQGKPTLLAYSSTKGAIVAFTRSLSKAVIDKGIRVNAVAPGPVLTPYVDASALIVDFFLMSRLWYASFDKEMLESSLKAPTVGHLAHPCTCDVRALATDTPLSQRRLVRRTCFWQAERAHSFLVKCFIPTEAPWSTVDQLLLHRCC